jgi:hypothetical protein
VVGRLISPIDARSDSAEITTTADPSLIKPAFIKPALHQARTHQARAWARSPRQPGVDPLTAAGPW